MAKTALDARAKTVIQVMACGEDKGFLDSIDSFHSIGSSGDEDAGEGMFDALIAKLVWVKRFGGDCVFANAGDDPSLTGNEQMHFGADCAGVQVNGKSTTVPENCLRAQINVTLSKVSQGDLQLGSSQLPCYWADPTHVFDGKHFTQTHGEWDATLRVLLRLYYLDADDRASTVIIDDAANNRYARTNVRENLLSVDGSPAQESYSLFQCGNQERSTGSAEDRADDHTWVDDALDSLGDLFDWFLKRLLLVVAAAAVILTLGIIAGPLAAFAVAIAAAATAAGIVAVAFLRIPETENHLMQINSAKFLINQMLLEQIGTGGDAHHLPQDQDSTREWLLRKMQSMVQRDFVEFNAMPYQRYTLGSIMNLHDFSHDPIVKAGAQAALEYYMVKYAIGSSELRRYSPFRRRAENLMCYVADGVCDNKGPARTVFDMTSGANHATALMQFFVGPSWSLPADALANDQSRLASQSSASEMHFPATSSFRPQALTVEIALNKSIPYLQRIRLRDGGAEVSWSGPSVLIGGGGVVTDHANPPFLAGIDVPGFLTSALSPDGDSDRGAAWPIVLVPHGHAADFMYFKDWIHFNGERVDVAKQSAFMYDHNLCIWKGFACGIDLVLPDTLTACLGGIPAAGGWMFIDSHDGRCASSPYASENRFFVAIFVDRINDASPPRFDGFLEIADADVNSSFDQFVQTVKARNHPPTSGIRGVYNSFSGHTIFFDTRGHQLDSNHTGIESIDGSKVANLDDWPHADGDILTGSWDSAVLTIRNPGYVAAGGSTPLPSSVRLDYSTWNNPHVDIIP